MYGTQCEEMPFSLGRITPFIGMEERIVKELFGWVVQYFLPKLPES
jgi:hypothetical protein